MSKQEYSWVVALATLAFRQQVAENQEDPSSRVMDTVTGVSGCLRHHERQAANELAAMVNLWVLFFALNLCQISRYSREIHRNRAKYFQNNAAPVLSPALAVFLAIQKLHETWPQFLGPDRPCQMITPLTATLPLAACH